MLCNGCQSTKAGWISKTDQFHFAPWCSISIANYICAPSASIFVNALMQTDLIFSRGKVQPVFEWAAIAEAEYFSILDLDCHALLLIVSNLVRNVPMLNSLEMSPF